MPCWRMHRTASRAIAAASALAAPDGVRCPVAWPPESHPVRVHAPATASTATYRVREKVLSMASLPPDPDVMLQGSVRRAAAASLARVNPLAYFGGVGPR